MSNINLLLYFLGNDVCLISCSVSAVIFGAACGFLSACFSVIDLLLTFFVLSLHESPNFIWLDKIQGLSGSRNSYTGSP